MASQLRRISPGQYVGPSGQIQRPKGGIVPSGQPASMAGGGNPPPRPMAPPAAMPASPPPPPQMPQTPVQNGNNIDPGFNPQNWGTLMGALAKPPMNQGVQGGGWQRVSPGVYQNAQGRQMAQANGQAPAGFRPPAQPPMSAFQKGFGAGIGGYFRG